MKFTKLQTTENRPILINLDNVTTIIKIDDELSNICFTYDGFVTVKNSITEIIEKIDECSRFNSVQ